MQNKKVELLAPAGNKEAFYGAIHAGADAVYLGGSRFGARAYADNFTEEELVACIRYAHIFGRKVYLTVNTLVKEAEFAELYDYLMPFYAAGLDGVIVQDIGVFTYIRGQFPGMELHVSTQMTITGKYGAGLLKDMGACRVVPARELSLDEIKDMKEATGMEIECFIHGAMCYCYSGQCLFSSILGGRSGNRGRCAQPCRLPYSVKDGKHTTKECYPLSLKDMCTIEMLPELIEAGIDSFKIEGRMKKPEYAAGVTSIYRKYIDKYYAAPEKEFRVSQADLEKLSRLYIRSERQNGYYHKHNGRDMVTLDSPAYSGSDEALLADIRSRYLEKAPKFPVTIYGCFQTGEKASVTILYENLSVTVEGEVVQEASKQPISSENIEKQLGKLGGSVFSAENVTVTVSENAFYSLKAINELRREAVVKLEELMIVEQGLCIIRELPARLADTVEQYSTEKDVAKAVGSTKSDGVQERTKTMLHISVQTLEQFQTVINVLCTGRATDIYNIARVYLSGDLFFGKTEQALNALLQQYSQQLGDTELIISMPPILRKRDGKYMEKLLAIAEEASAIIKGFRVSSLEALGFLRKREYEGKIYGDAGLYAWNCQTLKAWQELDGVCLPLELKGAEQRCLLEGKLSCEKLFYGRIPMMLTANCVAKTTTGCKNGNGSSEVTLIDRYQKSFPVVLNCLHCMNMIYNTLPLSLHNELGKWKDKVAVRLDFTIEGEQETAAVFAFFHKLLCGELAGKDCKPPFGEYTTGHEKRGVE